MTEQRKQNIPDPSSDAKRTRTAYKIMRLASDEITSNFRFLDTALHRLRPSANEELSLATDGNLMLFESNHIIRLYKSDINAVNRAFLHTLLHAVLCHHLTGEGMDRDRWDLACDIAVESVIRDLGVPAFLLKDEKVPDGLYAEIGNAVDELTAENIYHYLRSGNIPTAEIIALSDIVRRDTHSLWYDSDISRDNKDKEKKEKDKERDKKAQEWKEEKKNAVRGLKETSEGEAPALISGIEKIDKSIFRYNDFLIQFGRPKETLKVSNEEMDMIYYCYGLKFYGNLPLIEPLEYSEEHKVRDFIIAIDTSGSVKGRLVQRFVQHTHDLLKNANALDTVINLHILQCDNEIRESKTVRNNTELDEYLANIEIKGLGGTDFRPVFDYAEEQISNGVFGDFGGLIYFTDGFGTYPEHTPDYKTAFIICRSELDLSPSMPPWALSIALSEESIMKIPERI